MVFYIMIIPNTGFDFFLGFHNGFMLSWSLQVYAYTHSLIGLLQISVHASFWLLHKKIMLLNTSNATHLQNYSGKIQWI